MRNRFTREWPRVLLGLMCCIVSQAFTTLPVHAERELWVYCPANFLVKEECQRVDAVMERAAKAGYTHILVTDSKFSRLHEMDSRYFENIERLKAKAAELKLVLVPACCSVGYSNDLLSQNPNLAEALPVVQSVYRVDDKQQAVHEPDPKVALPQLKDRSRWGFIDAVFKPADDGLVASAPFDGNARIMKRVQTQKFQQYHAAVWIKTEDLSSPVEVKVLDDKGNNYNYTYLKTQPTQAWTEHHVTFNSLDNTELNFYIGVWGPEKGKLWLREPRLESTGAVNLVRRSTAPIRVDLIEGDKTVELKENVDFEAWQDPKLGRVPYEGEYEAWHTPPPIKLKRSLPSGSQLKVSYFHTHIIHDEQVCGTISDAEFEKLLEQQMTAVTRLIPSSATMMNHDEYRVMGWTKPSIVGIKPDASPGDLLTHNVKFCTATLLKANPKQRVMTWSDMFDPFHNAVDKYYLVNGSLRSATLPPSVWVMNWNSDKKVESLKHFERLGHHQIIAGYYDESPKRINEWLDVIVNNNIRQVDGVMYTTWRRNYKDLESFAAEVKKHKWFQ